LVFVSFSTPFFRVPTPPLSSSPRFPYTTLFRSIRTLGPPIFLPTSRLKRAPSQPTNVSKSRLFSRSQKEALRLTMCEVVDTEERDRKSTRLNSSQVSISYAVFCLKKKKLTRINS